MWRRTRHGPAAPGQALLSVLALLAMLVQVLFTADHLGASAVRAFGSEAGLSGFGIMEICAGDGVEIIGSGDGSGDDCPVCASAAVADFGEAGTAAPPAPSVTLLAHGWAPRREDHATALRPSGTKPIRAPPVVLT